MACESRGCDPAVTLAEFGVQTRPPRAPPRAESSDPGRSSRPGVGLGGAVGAGPGLCSPGAASAPRPVAMCLCRCRWCHAALLARAAQASPTSPTSLRSRLLPATLDGVGCPSPCAAHHSTSPPQPSLRDLPELSPFFRLAPAASGGSFRLSPSCRWPTRHSSRVAATRRLSRWSFARPQAASREPSPA